MNFNKTIDTAHYEQALLQSSGTHNSHTALEFLQLMHCLIMAGRPSIHELLARLLENPRFQDMLEQTTTSTNNNNIITAPLPTSQPPSQALSSSGLWERERGSPGNEVANFYLTRTSTGPTHDHHRHHSDHHK